MNVSVIIPVYNAALFVENAVKSVLCHTEVKEIILIEDYSTDNSYEICSKFVNLHNEIKLLRHPSGANKGAGAMRNIGLANVSQKYIAFLDADDQFLPNRFDLTKQVFESYPDADGVYGEMKSIYLDERAESSWNSKKSMSNFFSLPGENNIIPPDQLFENVIGYSKYANGSLQLDTLTLKSDSFRRKPVFFNESLRLHQDTDFINKLAYFFRLYPVGKGNPIAVRGIHFHNRITKINIESKKKLYDSLLNWSLNERIPKKYISYFRLKIIGLILVTDGNMKYYKFLKFVLCNKYNLQLVRALLNQVIIRSKAILARSNNKCHK